MIKLHKSIFSYRYIIPFPTVIYTSRRPFCDLALPPFFAKIQDIQSILRHLVRVVTISFSLSVTYLILLPRVYCHSILARRATSEEQIQFYSR